MCTTNPRDGARTPSGASTTAAQRKDLRIATKQSASRARSMAMHPSNYRRRPRLSALAAVGVGALSVEPAGS